MERPARLGRLKGLVATALADLFDQSQPLGRLALVHCLQSAATTCVAVSLAGTLFFSISPHAAEGKVILYLLLTVAPFAVVAPMLGPLLDRGGRSRRVGLITSAAGSTALCLLMAGNVHSLLLFPEAFGVLVLGKLYVITKAALVPAVVGEGDDLAIANARLAVLASFAGLAATPIAVGFLQLGAPWVLRLGFFLFGCCTVAALHLSRTTLRTPAPAPRARPPRAARRLGERGRSGEGGPGRWIRARPPSLSSPEVLTGVTAVSVVRGSFGFVTFFLAFALKRLHSATWWYGAVLLGSAIGGIVGSLLVPRLRRRLNERQIILASLIVIALGGMAAAFAGDREAQPLLSFVVGIAGTTAKPSLDSIAQRHVSPAGLGRAFARIETQLQLVWVIAALLGVVIALPIRAGDVVVAVACAVAAVFYISTRWTLGRVAPEADDAAPEGPGIVGV